MAGVARSRASVNGEDAQRIAIAALGFVASDEKLLPRFLDLTGLSPANIREAATEPSFLVSVLDFVVQHEPDALAFSRATNIPPEQIEGALTTLAGQAGPNPWLSV